MTLYLYPQPQLFDSSIARIRAATPVDKSAFYIQREYNVPWSANPTPLVLWTDEPGQLHTITINRQETISTVPGEEYFTIAIQLLKGGNHIEVRTDTQSTTVTIAATAIESWFYALGKSFYLNVDRRRADIRDALESPWSTRLSSFLLPMNDIFLPARMPNIHQTKMAIASVLGRASFGDGVRLMAQALSYTTPVISSINEAENVLPNAIVGDITTYPTKGEQRGKLIDIWLHNACLSTHIALIKLAINLGRLSSPPFSLLRFDDRQVHLSVGGELEVHDVDASMSMCSDLTFGCAEFRPLSAIHNRIEMVCSSPQLPFDCVVESPLSFGFWDEGYSLDSVDSAEPGFGNGYFDTIPAIDPFGDGFLGLSLSNRFDRPMTLDTRIQRAQRIAKFTMPLSTDITPSPSITPEGYTVVIDGLAGAPATISGASTIWGSTARLSLNIGDALRIEEPDSERIIASAWPAFDEDRIVKEGSAALSVVGTQVILTATDLFEFRHQGMGVIVNNQHYCIALIDGNVATLSGNYPTASGTFDVIIYDCIRDRNNARSQVESVLTHVTGNRLFEINLTAVLSATLVNGEAVSYLERPRALGAIAIGDSVITVASDVPPMTADLIYLQSTALTILSSEKLTTLHHTTRRFTYELRLSAPSPVAISDDSCLSYVRAVNDIGPPVTPLIITSLDPGAYVLP